jgi:hypothetical protein
MTLAHGADRLESARLVLRRIHSGRSAVLHSHPCASQSRAASLSRRPAALAPRDGLIFAVHFREL